jgi:glycosyltransferase involved in cell wall biosynthesis
MLVAQIGARMHYAVPRILEQAGILGALHTDVVATKGWPALMARAIPGSRRIAGIRRLLGRIPRGVPSKKIIAENMLGVQFAVRNQYCSTATQACTVHLTTAREFGRRVVRRGMVDYDSVYVFSTDGVEILEEAKRLGHWRIVEQAVAPVDIVQDVFVRERERFPDWVGENIINLHWREIRDREFREWELADVIVCGSRFVQDMIAKVGGPIEKTIIINYGVDSPIQPPRSVAHRGSEKTRVLFVGEVGFRKGAHYLIEAARQIAQEFEFRFCGSIALPEIITQNLPPNVSLKGIVPRAEINEQYAWADIFCLPSLVEGSATVTYEAMAAGLPIVTTPQSGSIVRDGIDGFLISPGDPNAIIDSLNRCRRGDLPARREPIRDRVDGPPSFTFDAYRERLLRLVRGAD